MNRLRPRIAIYADRTSEAAPSPIDQEMRRVFNKESFIIEPIQSRRDLLRPSLYRDLVMLVIPGINGEVSFYHDHIGPAYDLIRDYLRNGGTMFDQCAGANNACERTCFTPEWAPPRQRLAGNMGVFHGAGHGPVPGLGVNGNDPRFHRGLTAVRLTVEAGSMTRDITVAYSSGPAFIPARGSVQDIRVHARYTDGPGQPPAIISFSYGWGLVLLSGPVPHHGYVQVSADPQYKPLRDLMQKLEPHETDRIQFFDGLMHMVHAHAQKAGLIRDAPVYKAS